MEDIKALISKFSNLRHYNIQESGLPKGDWFVFETSPIPCPLPPLEELKKLASDIAEDKLFYQYSDGTLEHLENCDVEDHCLKKEISVAIKNITSQQFKFAIWANPDGILDNQPVVIMLEPEINKIIYPDHPHINSSFTYINYFVPNSICYTDEPSLLGNDEYTRIAEAIEQTSIWLFKHQIWLATRSKGNAIWIGPAKANDDKEQFSALRNLSDKCWCNSNKTYYQCHLQQDFDNWKKLNPLINLNLPFFNIDGSLNILMYQKYINGKNSLQIKTMNQLKNILL